MAAESMETDSILGEEKLTRWKAEALVAFESREIDNRSRHVVKVKEEDFWSCYQCNGGPWLLASVVICLGCNHQFDGQCLRFRETGH